MRTSPTQVMMRTTPCLCGCEGRDHRAILRRVVRDVVEVDEPDGEGRRIVRRGWIHSVSYGGRVEVHQRAHHLSGDIWVLGAWTRA